MVPQMGISETIKARLVRKERTKNGAALTFPEWVPLNSA
jgi:hypothetical protein